MGVEFDGVIENDSQYHEEMFSPGPLQPTSRRREPTAPRSRALTAIIVALVVATNVACAQSKTVGDRPLVVATTTQLADFARTIGGDAVEVRGLLSPNLDAHDYDPTPADLDALARAEVILANGVGLEPWLDDAATAAEATAPITDTSQGTELLDPGPNPHIWLDPHNARVMAANVTDAIADALAARAAPSTRSEPTTHTDPVRAVRQRGAAYDRQLVELDGELEAKLADLDSRKLVTDHDALAYFAHRYRLEVVGTIIPSFDSSAEVSAGDLQDLASTIARTGTRAVFTEQSLPDDAARTLADRAGVRVVSGEQGLYTDSLGPSGSPAATYLTMMRDNASTIAENLR